MISNSSVLRAIRPFESLAGYVGATVLLALVLAKCAIGSVTAHFDFASLSHESTLLIMIGFTGLAMTIYEISARVHWHRRHAIVWFAPNSRPFGVLAWSALVRFLTTGGVLAVGWCMVHYHYYFQTPNFSFTRVYYSYMLGAYFLLGYPYHLFTLLRLGRQMFEFNDYALLTLLGIKGFWLWSTGKIARWPMATARGRRMLTARRVRKAYLVYLVNFFFLPLMTSFFAGEYTAFSDNLSQVMTPEFGDSLFFQQYHRVYLSLYHLIFVLDLGIAIIGYTLASRWLDNRSKSVDMTLRGWFAVLLCYPPMSIGFTDQFIGYGIPKTTPFITSEWALMVLMPLIIFCFIVYLWATMALGFRFSNFNNRGVVSIGPYRYFRHPAYTMKNLAWWLDNTQVLTNIWSALALLIWNGIYMLRGITEEQHLMRDPDYRGYQKEVPGRFLPSWSKSQIGESFPGIR